MKPALLPSQYIIILSLFLLSSCAFFSNKKDPNLREFKNYIQGSGFRRSHLDSIKKTLTRTATMAGNIYKIELIPMTRPLIEAISDDQAAALSLTQKEKKLLYKNLALSYLNHKTCFEFKYEVIRIQKSSQLKDWSIEFIDHNQVSHKASWLSDALEDNPIESYAYIGSVKEPIWYGKGIACSDHPVDLTQNFSIKVISSYTPFPFSNNTTLTWQYPKYEVIDGTEREVKEDSKDFKGYRGW